MYSGVLTPVSVLHKWGLVDDVVCRCVFLHIAQAAAHRMVAYWKFRVQFFPDGRAFRPMTLLGAMHEELDVAVKGIPTIYTMLPPDQHGRTMLFIDTHAYHTIDRMTNVSYLPLCDSGCNVL